MKSSPKFSKKELIVNKKNSSTTSSVDQKIKIVKNKSKENLAYDKLKTGDISKQDYSQNQDGGASNAPSKSLSVDGPDLKGVEQLILTKKVTIINGPNLNLLGEREKTFYGSLSLQAIAKSLKKIAKTSHSQLSFFQSNSEGEIINAIHKVREKADFIIINAGAFTHTSIAIRDALLAVNIPYYEVHCSNVFSREPFRHKSYLSDKAVAVITGLGAYGYVAALKHALKKVK